MEYKGLAVNGVETPWTTGGILCGTRGQALPLIGFAVALRGAAAEHFDCVYEATFVGGGPLPSLPERRSLPLRRAGRPAGRHPAVLRCQILMVRGHDFSGTGVPAHMRQHKRGFSVPALFRHSRASGNPYRRVDSRLRGNDEKISYASAYGRGRPCGWSHGRGRPCH